jgi:hypothetical protein
MSVKQSLATDFDFWMLKGLLSVEVKHYPTSKAWDNNSKYGRMRRTSRKLEICYLHPYGNYSGFQMLPVSVRLLDSKLQAVYGFGFLQP